MILATVTDSEGFVAAEVNGQMKPITPRLGRMSGICQDSDGLIYVSDHKSIYKCEFVKPNLRIIEAVELGEWDIHDILARDGYLYLTKTATNCIARARLSNLANFEEVWRIHPDESVDKCHLNSFDMNSDGQMIATAFTLERGDRINRNIRKEGVLLTTFDGKETTILEDQLDQPHSARFKGDEIYHCSSAECLVADCSNRKFQTTSYTRGLRFSGEHTYLGMSKHRYSARRHQFTGVLDITPSGIRQISMPVDQVYDILVLEEP